MKHQCLFDNFDGRDDANIYCTASELVDEASVEGFFVARMLEDLGHHDKHIKLKHSVSDLTVFVGSQRVDYKPDYAIIVPTKPRWIIGAKSPDEELDRWVGQCAGYCLAANR